jgi:hypothetical protein
MFAIKAAVRDLRSRAYCSTKFYRQATNEIVGISEGAAAFLGRFF